MSHLLSSTTIAMQLNKYIRVTQPWRLSQFNQDSDNTTMTTTPTATPQLNTHHISRYFFCCYLSLLNDYLQLNYRHKQGIATTSSSPPRGLYIHTSTFFYSFVNAPLLVADDYLKSYIQITFSQVNAANHQAIARGPMTTKTASPQPQVGLELTSTCENSDGSSNGSSRGSRG